MNKAKRYKDESGAALVIAMILMLALVVFTLSAFELLTASVQISGNHKNDSQALYVADAGIEDAIYQLRLDRNWNTGFTDKDFSGNSYTVSVTPVITDGLGNQVVVDVESAGTAGNFTRAIIARIKIVGTPEFPELVYSVAMLSWKEKVD